MAISPKIARQLSTHAGCLEYIREHRDLITDDEFRSAFRVARLHGEPHPVFLLNPEDGSIFATNRGMFLRLLASAGSSEREVPQELRDALHKPDYEPGTAFFVVVWDGGFGCMGSVCPRELWDNAADAN
jgi:hypothetical protein